MALMVPPTHPCPPFDNGLVRKGKATLAAEACAMVGSASAVEMIGLIGLVGGSGTVRAVKAIGAFDVVGTVKSVEAAELLELVRTADTWFDPSLRCVAMHCTALHCTAMATNPLSKGGGVWVGGTVVPHGCGSRAPKDGFTARPANPHTPDQATDIRR